jgi:YfiH family protein
MLQQIDWPIKNIDAYYSKRPLDFANHLDFPKLPTDIDFISLKQTHGNHVKFFSEHTDEQFEADAMVTAVTNMALIIRTADCLPILISTESGGIIAAIHAGWRSLQKNIIENTIESIFEVSKDPLYAWLGPCICQKHFEVGNDVYDAFTANNNHYQTAFSKGANNKYNADLKQIATIKLNNKNVNFIKSLNECTYCSSDKYYSYRRNKDAGRMACIIYKTM